MNAPLIHAVYLSFKNVLLTGLWITYMFFFKFPKMPSNLILMTKQSVPHTVSYINSTHSLTCHSCRSLFTCLSWVTLRVEENMFWIRNRTEDSQSNLTLHINAYKSSETLQPYIEALGAWHSHDSCGSSVSNRPCRAWTTIFTWGTLNKGKPHFDSVIFL